MIEGEEGIKRKYQDSIHAAPGIIILLEMESWIGWALKDLEVSCCAEGIGCLKTYLASTPITGYLGIICTPSLATWVAYVLYQEVCDGELDPAWKNNDPVPYWESRDGLSTQ
eukprot:14904626-Ditylum_brightwellii.AAC.2